MSTDHFLPLFYGDFLASTATWSGPERGLFLQLLGCQWASGPLPADCERLARAVNYEVGEFSRLWPVIAPKFQLLDGKLVNRRLETIREKNAEVQAKRLEGSRKGVQARRELGQIRPKSEPVVDAEVVPEVQPKVGPMDRRVDEPPDDASVNHPNRTDPNLSEPSKSKRPAFDPAIVDGLDPDAWQQWLAYRINIRKPLKAASLKVAAEELAKFGAEQGSVVRHSIANGYQGLFSPKQGPANGNGRFHGQTPQVSRSVQERIRLAQLDIAPHLREDVPQLALMASCTEAEVIAHLHPHSQAAP